MNIDKAISAYRKAAKAHADATFEWTKAHATLTATQRALMLAKDDLREAEREGKETLSVMQLA